MTFGQICSGCKWCYEGHKWTIMPYKSYVIIIISNIQGQIMQINFIRKDCLTWIMLRAANSIYSLHFAVWPAKRSFLERVVCHLAACSDNNGCDLLSLGQSPRLVCFEDVFWCFPFLSLALFPWQKFHWPWQFPSLFCCLSWASAYVLSFASHVIITIIITIIIIGPIYLLIVLSNHRHCLSTVCHAVALSWDFSNFFFGFHRRANPAAHQKQNPQKINMCFMTPLQAFNQTLKTGCSEGMFSHNSMRD